MLLALPNHLLAKVLQGDARVRGVDLAEAGFDDVVRQPLDKGIRLVLSEGGLMLRAQREGGGGGYTKSKGTARK